MSAATVTVNDAGYVLMLRRADNDEWQIPGGIVDAGEQPPEAAVRETFEETGIHVVLKRCTGVYTHTGRGIFAFVFLAQPVSGRLTTSSETAEVRWMPSNEAMELASDVFRPRISDSLGSHHHVLFRAHDGVTITR